ncbi:hypothetical protein NCCP2495_33030 [Dietzia sp. NCCP-2495]|uniref:hypothetical protein n=1 Tax=Dietzia sp. NCCP-2495 TaxID=2934675 RepID=UPI00222F3C08|nr:hypothetical protein [Dietzia sp. NCCP-2495]GLB65422.1 hypothetical protein NCCP2495_33030 [Dietzia sp. NCCP-2495]
MTGESRRDPLEDLDHDTLARLLPDLLLIGQLIDRAGMPALLGEFGVDGMRDVAIEEWQAASPHYARRMKEALQITGDGVAEIFKGFQLDVGAPPEFMDFRYGVTDHDHGEFWLDHCGALMDVEPMGDRLVTTMCHDIEDPTFPATALATNPRAVVEPIHRPPRSPEGRTPHCHWVVRIDPDVEPAPMPGPAIESASSRLIDFRFDPPVPRDDTGQGWRDDYSGSLLTDLVFREFTSAALIRTIREVYLQMHLLAVGFHQSVRRRSDAETADRLLAYQATGISGVAAGRIRDILAGAVVNSDAAGVSEATETSGAAELAAVLDLHPLSGPTAYTGYSSHLSDDGRTLTVTWDTEADGFADDTWLPQLAAGDLRPLRAAAHAVDPRWIVESVPGDGARVEAVLRLGSVPTTESEEVAVTRLSTGAAFSFGPARTPLPITPV